MSQECEKKSLAGIFSLVLRGDYDVVINVMNDCEAFDYPFNCVASKVLNSIAYVWQLLFETGLFYLWNAGEIFYFSLLFLRF